MVSANRVVISVWMEGSVVVSVAGERERETLRDGRNSNRCDRHKRTLNRTKCEDVRRYLFNKQII
jgi:hypothetical protein